MKHVVPPSPGEPAFMAELRQLLDRIEHHVDRYLRYVKLSVVVSILASMLGYWVGFLTVYFLTGHVLK
jgi:hypothetical protein